VLATFTGTAPAPVNLLKIHLEGPAPPAPIYAAFTVDQYEEANDDPDTRAGFDVVSFLDSLFDDLSCA
jgi:hypothetical protein